MSLRQVFISWLEAGVEPDGTADLTADDQRRLVADIYSVEPSLLQDALAESLAHTPAYGAEIVAALREGDIVHVGAFVDRILRRFLIGSPWIETEMREVQEQESTYDEDL